MAKYDSLFQFLCRVGDAPIEMSFDEIEALVGTLPRSATVRREWWGNDAGDKTLVQTQAWLNAGRQVEWVDRDQRRVRFSSAGWRRGS